MRPELEHRGFTLVEMLFALGVAATLSGMALPPVLRVLEDYRTAGAARYVATRLQRARMEAVRRSANVAVRFADAGEFSTYVDGNGNGVLSADIRDGIDPQLGATERLESSFRDVSFGTLAGLPPVDAGGSPPGADPIHLGASGIASFSPAGTSSSGSVFVRSGTCQLVVRVYGDTGKTRILRFEARSRQWRPL
jgi:prepilin-type N-terminal cleavage/methylation domain-containing protein